MALKDVMAIKGSSDTGYWMKKTDYFTGPVTSLWKILFYLNVTMGEFVNSNTKEFFSTLNLTDFLYH